MLLSYNEIFNVFHVLKDIEAERIRAVEIIGMLQMSISMRTSFQTFKMIFSSPKKVCSRANVKMSAVGVNNGINTRGGGNYIFQRHQFSFVHLDMNNINDIGELVNSIQERSRYI